jgi:hypothetical protein
MRIIQVTRNGRDHHVVVSEEEYANRLKGRLHIEVVHYKGKNGSYATHTMPLWLPRIVGVNGCKRNCDQSAWHGDSNKDCATALAKSWAEMLGCPIIETEAAERVGGGPPE